MVPNGATIKPREVPRITLYKRRPNGSQWSHGRVKGKPRATRGPQDPGLFEKCIHLLIALARRSRFFIYCDLVMAAVQDVRTRAELDVILNRLVSSSEGLLLGDASINLLRTYKRNVKAAKDPSIPGWDAKVFQNDSANALKCFRKWACCQFGQRCCLFLEWQYPAGRALAAFDGME